MEPIVQIDLRVHLSIVDPQIFCSTTTLVIWLIYIYRVIYNLSLPSHFPLSRNDESEKATMG